MRTLGTAPTQQNIKSKTKSVSTKCLRDCQNETPVSGAANPIPELALCNLCFFHLVNIPAAPFAQKNFSILLDTPIPEEHHHAEVSQF